MRAVRPRPNFHTLFAKFSASIAPILPQREGREPGRVIALMGGERVLFD